MSIIVKVIKGKHDERGRELKNDLEDISKG
jgi:hypothetical protein